MEKKNVGMRIEVGKLLDKEYLKTAGKKGSAVPENGIVDASNVNLAILAMVESKPFTVTVKPVVTLVNWPAGSNNYFPTVKFVAPAGTMFAGVVKSGTEKVLELEHYRVWNEKEHKYTEARPSAIREEEIVPDALKALETKLFPKSDLTDKPVPPTDYCTLLAREFGWDSEHLMKAAEYCEKYGMTFRGLYEGEVQKRKMKK